MKLNITKIIEARKNLVIEGVPRKALIEEAIATIQKDPKGAFLEGYFGIKNYAHFGDQREDHQYGFCPSYGAVVFSVGRTRRAIDNKIALGEDEIYYLEAYRDFGAQRVKINYEEKCITLGICIDNIFKAQGELNFFNKMIDETNFEFVGNYQ